MVDAVPHARLRREMDHADRAMLAHDRRDGWRIRHVHHAEGKSGHALQAGQPRPLQRRIVIVVEIVDPDDRLAAGEQNGARSRDR